MSWNPLKLKYRRAQSGPYVFMNLVSYNNWVDTNEIPPDGLAYLHSPLGCPVFALHDTIEYIACACVHQDPPPEFLGRVRVKTKHLSLIAEMLFVLDEISDFEKMIAIYPEVAVHILGIELTSREDLLEKAQGMVRSMLATKASLEALADIRRCEAESLS